VVGGLATAVSTEGCDGWVRLGSYPGIFLGVFNFYWWRCGLGSLSGKSSLGASKKTPIFWLLGSVLGG